MAATKDMAVARKKASGSESRRFNTLVRMEDALIEKAKVIASIKGISLGELFSPVLWPFIEKEWKKQGRKMLGDQGGDE